MRIEFLADGSPDCPLIRLSAIDTVEVCHLKSGLLRLAEGEQDELSLHDYLPGESAAGCQLTLLVTENDHGITRRRQKGAFVCRLTRSSWRSVAERLSLFCQGSEPGRYQWLDESGEISWLLSPDGNW